MDTGVSDSVPSGLPLSSPISSASDMMYSNPSPPSPSTPSYLDLDKQEINVGNRPPPSSLTVGGVTASPVKSSDTSPAPGSRRTSSPPEKEPMDNLFPLPPAKRARTSNTAEDNRMDALKDTYCWICHKDRINVSCSQCVRSYHYKCIPSSAVSTTQQSTGHKMINTSIDFDWVCVECNSIKNGEENKCKNLQKLEPEEFHVLLRFALTTIKQTADVTFHIPVNETLFPDYKETIIYPMDFDTIERNIRAGMYNCTEAFLADVKWILHNCYIFNNHNHPLTKNAQYFYRIAKNEMSEIAICPDCFHNFYIYRDRWFEHLCKKPHALVFARLKGHPFWPAKLVRINKEKQEVDVRFFGAHERAWVPVDSCFALSKEYVWNKPKGQKNKLDAALKELGSHIEKIQDKYGEFKYAKSKTPFDPKQIFLFDTSDDENDAVYGGKSESELSNDSAILKPCSVVRNNGDIKRAVEDEIEEEDDDDDDDDDEKKLVVALGEDEPSNHGTNSDRESGKKMPKVSNGSSTPSTPKDGLSTVRKPKIKFGKGSGKTPSSKTGAKVTQKITLKPTSQPKQAPICTPHKPAQQSLTSTEKPSSATVPVPTPTTSSSDVKRLREEILILKRQIKNEQVVHQNKISEMNKSMETALKELKELLTVQKEKALQEAAEKHRKELEIVKKKQWCSFCLTESIYFCCWNTSYCSFTCQTKHWPKHMGECQQQQNQQKTTQNPSDGGPVGKTNN